MDGTMGKLYAKCTPRCGRAPRRLKNIGNNTNGTRDMKRTDTGADDMKSTVSGTDGVLKDGVLNSTDIRIDMDMENLTLPEGVGTGTGHLAASSTAPAS